MYAILINMSYDGYLLPDSYDLIILLLTPNLSDNFFGSIIYQKDKIGGFKEWIMIMGFILRKC